VRWWAGSPGAGVQALPDVRRCGQPRTHRRREQEQPILNAPGKNTCQLVSDEPPRSRSEPVHVHVQAACALMPVKRANSRRSAASPTHLEVSVIFLR